MKQAVILCLLLVLGLPIAAFGQIQAFVKEHTLQMSDDDSRNSVRARAQDQLRTMILMEVGSFVQAHHQSTFTVSGGRNVEDLYREAVSISTQGRVSLRVLDEKFEGTTYWVRAEMRVDIGEINASLARMQREVEETERARRQNSEAVTRLRSQIEISQRQVSELESREQEAQTRRRFAITNVSRAKETKDKAENEHREAIAILNTNPSSQSAQRMVNLALEDFNTARRTHSEEEAKASTAENTWQTAAGDLAREREHLENLRNQLRQLGAGAISAEAVNTQRQQPTSTPTNQSRADVAFSELEARRGGATSSNLAETKTTLSSQIAQQSPAAQNQFLFSVRPEFRANNVVAGLGLNLELGMINAHGFYLTASFDGGAAYFGGGGNIGFCFNSQKTPKNVLGITAGYWNQPLRIETIDDNGNRQFRESTPNVSIVGAFWKLMLGQKHNFDITNKILFGFKHDVSDGGFVNRNFRELNTTYSLSIGYTLTRKR